MRYSSKRVAVSSIFGVLIFLVDLIPPPTSRFFQLFTALFITTAALTVHRPGGATYACLIAGILDAFYTGLPIAFLLFAVRGGTFDLALSILKLQNPPSQFKIASSSVLSSLTTGFTAYFVLVKWLRTVAVPLETFMLFIMISTILSGIGAILGVKLWQRLQ